MRVSVHFYATWIPLDGTVCLAVICFFMSLLEPVTRFSQTPCIYASHTRTPTRANCLSLRHPRAALHPSSRGLVDCQKMVTHRIPGVPSLCHAADAPPSHPGFREGTPSRLHPTGATARRIFDRTNTHKLCDARARQRRGENREREGPFDRAHIPCGKIFL